MYPTGPLSANRIIMIMVIIIIPIIIHYWQGSETVVIS